MKAAYITRTGPPECIHYDDLPAPVPAPGQCLVKVGAVDVNPVDCYVRSGAIPGPASFPQILGRDLAGTVVEAGPEVKRFKTGDRVWATNLGFAGRPGTFSELAAVDECWLHPIPPGVTDETIAAISLVGVTAWLGLMNHAKLKPGETLFVNGGTGGVGSCVVQMAKIIGAKVITTAGSDQKVETARKLGADLAINYRSRIVQDAVKEFAPNGVDVWWETLREPNFERTIPLLALRGRMVVMAGRNAKPAFPVGPFYVKDCSLLGFAMFNTSAQGIQAAAEPINAWLASGKMKAQIDRVIPLSETAHAHRLQEDSTIRKKGLLTGKIVLKP